MFDKGNEDYRRHSGISEFILQRAREEYGPKVTHEDVFFYVYGLLHSLDYPPSYSSRFDALSALSLTLTSITTLCYNFFVLMEKEQIINKKRHMRVYLDNCCYNRPFDIQTQTAIKIESDAKLLIQGLMRTGVLEYAWSFMLRMEVSRNPDYQRKKAIQDWANGAAIDIPPSVAIRLRASDLMRYGIKSADAIHLACAEQADCDWFFTVDRGILKKLKRLGEMRVENPVEFVLEGIR